MTTQHRPSGGCGDSRVRTGVLWTRPGEAQVQGRRGPRLPFAVLQMGLGGDLQQWTRPPSLWESERGVREAGGLWPRLP